MAMKGALIHDNFRAAAPFRPPPAHGERRIMHYSSLQKILLVGEGDFSFSNALATAFGHGRNIIATSLDSQEKLLKKYADAAAFTLSNLKKLGALLFHEVDATRMAEESTFCNLAFDCVVYNFPHVGFHGPEDSKKVIKQHKELVRLFFENAARLLRFKGEVHVSHKVSSPYSKWKLEKQATRSGLVLKEACDFYQGDYPGYVNRRGDGSNSAGTFHLGKCKTFIFMINPVQFHPWRELPHLLGRSLGLFHKIFERRRVASASVLPAYASPFPFRPEQRALNLFEPSRMMDPPTVMLPMRDISSMKRRRDDDEYGMHDWEVLEHQRFSKRGCFGFLHNARDRDGGACIQQSRPPALGRVHRPLLPMSQLLHRPFVGGILPQPHMQGMFPNARMHPSAGHALLPLFH